MKVDDPAFDPQNNCKLMHKDDIKLWMELAIGWASQFGITKIKRWANLEIHTLQFKMYLEQFTSRFTVTMRFKGQDSWMYDRDLGSNDLCDPSFDPNAFFDVLYKKAKENKY